MKTITIKNDSLNVLIDKTKVNINDILKDFWNGNDTQLKMQFTAFYDYYYKMCKETKLDKLMCCVLTLSMCNFSLPKLNLNTDNNQISEIYNKIKKEKTIVYMFTTRKELVSIILFHYITHNYKLKHCPVCNNFFITKEERIKYCSDNCRKKNNSSREMKRRKNNPIVSLDKKITDMLSIRNDIESENLYKEYRKEYDTNKAKYSQKQMIKWLEEKHKELKRR